MTIVRDDEVPNTISSRVPGRFSIGVRLDLELVEVRRFRKGVIVLRYAVRG